MTVRKLKAVTPRLEALIAEDRDLLKTLAEEALNQVLQAEVYCEPSSELLDITR